MSRRIKPWQDVRTAGDVKNYARGRGAQVENKGDWDVIKAPGGTIHITPNNRQKLDKQTLGNLKRWLKLVGLALLCLLCSVIAFAPDLLVKALGK